MKIDWSFVITIAAICLIIIMAIFVLLAYNLCELWSRERVILKAIESEANIVIEREVF